MRKFGKGRRLSGRIGSPSLADQLGYFSLQVIPLRTLLRALPLVDRVQDQILPVVL